MQPNIFGDGLLFRSLGGIRDKTLPSRLVSVGLPSSEAQQIPSKGRVAIAKKERPASDQRRLVRPYK